MSDAVPFATFCLVFRKTVVGSHDNTERRVMLAFTNNACLSRLCSVLFCSVVHSVHKEFAPADSKYSQDQTISTGFLNRMLIKLLFSQLLLTV